MNADPDDTGRARYFQLQTLARRQGRDTQELLTLYAQPVADPERDA